MRTSPSGSRSSPLGRSTLLLRLLPNILNGRKSQSLSAGPIIRTVKLYRVLVDGGSGLNILFAKTLDDMKILRSELKRSRAPFHGVIPGTSATPLRMIKLSVTFGSRENFWTEDITFEVADFK